MNSDIRLVVHRGAGPAGGSLAFPNAYVNTDEPPRRSRLRRASFLAAVAGVGYLGLVILLLSLFWSAYNPITQVASDYGVGSYSFEMNSGFFLAGVGVIALALGIVFSPVGRAERTGAALLIPAGLALVVNAFYQTDLEGASRTLHGTIHGVGGAVFFFTAPVGLTLLARGYGRVQLVLTLIAFIAAIVLLAAIGALGLDSGGLGERVLILVTFSSLILTSVGFLRET